MRKKRRPVTASRCSCRIAGARQEHVLTASRRIMPPATSAKSGRGPPKRCPFGSSARRARYTSVRRPSTSRHPQGPSAPSSYVSVSDNSAMPLVCVDDILASSAMSGRVDGIGRLWMRATVCHGMGADSFVCAQPEQVRTFVAVSNKAIFCFPSHLSLRSASDLEPLSPSMIISKPHRRIIYQSLFSGAHAWSFPS